MGSRRTTANLVAMVAAIALVLGLAPAASAQGEPGMTVPAGYESAAHADSSVHQHAPQVAQVTRDMEMVPSARPLEGDGDEFDAGDRANQGLVLAGTMSLSATYTANVLLSLAAVSVNWDIDEEAYLNASLVPVVGPWIQLAYAVDGGTIALGILAGLGQAAGLAMLIAGFTVARSPVNEVTFGESTRVTFTASATDDSAGLAAFGSF